MSVVLVSDTEFPDLDFERATFAREGFEMEVAGSRDPDAIVAAAPLAEALIVMWAPVDYELIKRLPKLKVIGRFGTGVDIIDLEAATRLGIAVVNAGHYATEEVAVHTVGMILALLRRLVYADREVRAGYWGSSEELRLIRRLSQIRSGVVGLGHIGRRVASHLAGLGMQVLGYDPVAVDVDVPRVKTLEDLLSSSDIVSLHVPLSPETTRLLDAERIGLLPHGAFVVNTSRGEVVDQDALIRALNTGELGGAALDVFRDEPLPKDHVFCSMQNVLLTPHIAYYSQESVVQARETTVSAVVEVLKGGFPPEVVNPGYRQVLRSSG